MRETADGFAIGGRVVAPGSEVQLDVPVGVMSTGTPLALALRVIHGVNPGPCVFVSAAIHGDEIIGIEIVRRLRRQLARRPLAGTVILVPVANEPGFVAGSRYLPDRRDLNRSFPGSARGSLAAQLAGCFLAEVVRRSSLGIDIHSAAVHRYNLPQLRIAADDPGLLDLAIAFGPPAVIEAPLRDGSLRAVAAKEGVPMLLLEAGEALRFDDYSIRVGLAGTLRVLARLGMIEDRDIPGTPANPARSRRTLWLRAPRGGIVRLSAQSGARVAAGDQLGTVADLLGEHPVPLIAPIDGIVIGHANLPVANSGDALLHIAEVMVHDTVAERLAAISAGLLSERLLDEDEVI